MLTILKRIDQLTPAPTLTLQALIPVVPAGTTAATSATLQQLANLLPPNNTLVFKQSFSGSALQNTNTTPITLLAAPGTNLLYAIIPGTAYFKYTYGTVVYNFGVGGLQLNNNAVLGTITQAQINSAVSITEGFSTLVTPGTNTTNQPLLLFAPGANATTGDGVLTIGFDYRIIDLT